MKHQRVSRKKDELGETTIFCQEISGIKKASRFKNQNDKVGTIQQIYIHGLFSLTQFSQSLASAVPRQANAHWVPR